MSPLNPNSVRPPAVAGRFYPADPTECRSVAQSYLQPDSSGHGPWLGGIVPHAGWICSGAVAGRTIATLAAQGPVDVVVVFGAIHTPLPTHVAALDSHAIWSLPAGQSNVSQSLYQELLDQQRLFMMDDRFHVNEHAVEVNVPMIQLAYQGAALLPIEIPPTADAAQMGRQTARAISESGVRAVYLASSDFTHYGPNYRFAPVGAGPAAMEWTKENDRRMLDLVTRLQTDAIVPEAHNRLNACGAGAIAAMLAACQELGATHATVLQHTTSYETLRNVAPQPPTNAVGYAAVVIG